jgi:hypothetical protein
MGILDDAIKEHLELKRQHGAAEDELKQLEDEAFGAAERPGGKDSPPDSLAEAPTEFMSQPDLEAPPAPDGPDASAEEPAPGRRAEIADVQESPAPEAEEPRAEPEPPAEEESPAMEHDAILSTGPTTEEREAIAEQPTEMFDVEEELSASQAEAPSEEELVEEGIEEPRLAPVDPLAGLDDDSEDEAEDEYEEDDDFWDEKRLSDELDQALEAPTEVEDIEDEEARFEDAATEPESVPEPEPESEPEPRSPSGGEEEDVLEETPDFLEEAPEDDQLWFEQKPPKDFDFDD